VLAGAAADAEADPAATAAVGALARLREDCRRAKERLSADTVAVVPVALPAFQSDVRVTRPELEQLIAGPLAGVLNAIDDTLQRNQIAPQRVTAVATVGGGAAIPLITQRLSERWRAPVITTPQPQFNVAAGAALISARGGDADAPTGLAPAADVPTAMSSAAWAAGAAGLAASESASDGAASATFRALAWSQDDSPAEEPVPYTGADYSAGGAATGARPPVDFTDDTGGYQAEPAPLPWYKRPPVLFAFAAAAALAAMGGLAYTLTSATSDSTPVTETATEFSEPPPGDAPPPPNTPQTVTVTGSDGRPST